MQRKKLRLFWFDEEVFEGEFDPSEMTFDERLAEEPRGEIAHIAGKCGWWGHEVRIDGAVVYRVELS
jgi:hypothetical protein